MVVALALSACVVGLTACRGGGSDAAAPGPRAANCSPGALRVDRTLRASRGVDAMARGAGALWATNPIKGTLTRLDPHADGAPRRDFPIGRAPIDVTAGYGRIWVADRDGDRVVGFDPRRDQVDRRFRIGVPVATSLGNGGLWILGLDDGRLVRVNPRTGGVLADIDAQVLTPSRMAAFGRDIWLMGGTGLVPVDAKAGRYTRGGVRLVASAATDLVAGVGALWVPDPSDHALLRINPSTTAQVSYPTPKGTAPVAVAVVGCAVVAAGGRGQFAVFDPFHEHWVGRPVHVGQSVGSLLADGDAVWASDPQAGVVRRLLIATSHG